MRPPVQVARTTQEALGDPPDDDDPARRALEMKRPATSPVPRRTGDEKATKEKNAAAGTCEAPDANVRLVEAKNGALHIPPQCIVALHSKQCVLYTGLLALAHERGLVRLKARLVRVTPELALAEAEATFADGRVFTESSDATPATVRSTIRAHFPRRALTRAKARCLRDGLNIGLVCLEELEE